MIDVRELTIGSLVADELGETCIVEEVCAQGAKVEKVSADHEPSRWLDEEMKPIPLTAEWLERLGFVKGLLGEVNWADGTKSYQYEHPLFAEYSIYNHHGDPNWDMKRGGWGHSLYTVHQLQAFVFHLEHYWLTLTPATPTP